MIFLLEGEEADMMTAKELKKLVEGCERYLQVANSHGDDIAINSIPKCDIGVATVRFEGHQGETWEKELWIDIKGALHIESPETRESVFDFAADFGWSEEEIYYIKYGE